MLISDYAATDINEAKEIFAKYGFVLIKQFLNDDEYIDALGSEANKYVERFINAGPVRSGHYTYYSSGLPTLWGADDFLSVLSKRQKERLLKTNFVETCNLLLDEGFVCSSLKICRVHVQRCTDLHKLAWHHDEKEVNRALVANLYLEAESGFRITPKHHMRNSGVIQANKIGKGYFDLIRDFVTIDAGPGDLLVFDGMLLHQPYNRAERLHLHFSFSVADAELSAISGNLLDGSIPTEPLCHKDLQFRNELVLKGAYGLKLICDYLEEKLLHV